MKKATYITLTFAATLFVSIVGHTQQTSASSFEPKVREAQKMCVDLRCENSPVKAVLVNMQNANELPQELKQQLTQSALEIANNHWPDTIFEGGIVSADEDNIRLEKVSTLHEEQGMIGYRISYSSQAYNVDQCIDFRDVKTCQKGTIHESAFVSADLVDYFTDETDVAHFIENAQNTK